MPTFSPSPAMVQDFVRRVSAESYTQPEYGTLWVTYESATGAPAAKTLTPSGSIAWSGGPMAADVEQTYLCMLIDEVSFTVFANDNIDATAAAAGGAELKIDASGIYKLGFGISQGDAPGVTLDNSGSALIGQGAVHGVPSKSGTLQPWALGADTVTFTPQSTRTMITAQAYTLRISGYIWNSGTTERPAWFAPLSDQCDPSAIPGRELKALSRAYQIRQR
jgi:hypothetical protein